MKGEGNGEALVDVEAAEVGEAGGEEVEEEVGGGGGSDSEGGAGEALEAEPAAADEGAGVAAGFGVEAAEDLHH